MKRILTMMMVLSLSACLLTGCGGGDSKPETTKAAETTAAEATASETEEDPYAGLTFYESETGISLYMSDGYTEGQAEGILCYFEGEASAVNCQKDTFESLASAGFSSDITEAEYAELVLQVHGFEGEVQTDSYGNVSISYVQEVEGAEITYYAFFDKGSDSMWMTTFMCVSAQTALYEEQFRLWASSIQVP